MRTELVDNISARIVDALAPQRCFWCGMRGREAVCAGCRASLPWNENACRACAIPLVGDAGVCGECLEDAPVQDSTWVAFRYAAPVSREIVELKFHGKLAPAHVLGALMAQCLALRPQTLPELLIPAPLHPSRLRRRGYNQAVELGRELAKRLPVLLAPHLARRVRATAEQSRLDAAARRRNVRDAFEFDRSVGGKSVALLDDVITTGATVRELARAAQMAGARSIEVWAAARVAQV